MKIMKPKVIWCFSEISSTYPVSQKKGLFHDVSPYFRVTEYNLNFPSTFLFVLAQTIIIRLILLVMWNFTLHY